jgi:conjugative transfer signal peptidase TraF
VVRRLAIALLAVLLLFCGAFAAGLRLNGSPSEPIGFYWTMGNRPQKGDLVFVRLPSTPLFALAKERGYLNVGGSPALHLIKRLVGVAGDEVTINAAGVAVNGIRLFNSKPLTKDGAGRPLSFHPLQNYTLCPGEVLLMSDYSPASFDARYFGPLQATTIESVIKPILTWK